MVSYSFDLATFEYFLLILVRITAFVVVAPFFGMSSTPGRVRIGFSAFIAILLYQVVLPKDELIYSGVFSYSILVIKEAIVGLLIGFGANICNTIIQSAGKFIDMAIGLSMATEFDPTTRTEVSVVSSLYNYCILLLMVITNMHYYIFRALVDSYSVIPVGHTFFQWDHLLNSMVQFMTDTFVISFRIYLPVFAVITILNCILGIMAKVAPQMNMFSVGMQIKLLVGLMVMFVTVFLMPDIANYIFKEMKAMLILIVGGMQT